MKLADYKALKEGLESIAKVTALVSNSSTVSYLGVSNTVSITGATYEYLNVQNYKLSKGRFINSGDRLTFNKKIILTFIIIIIISLILYASLIVSLFTVNFKNAKFMHELRRTPGLNENTIKNIEEFNKMPREKMLPPLIILRPDVLFKITFILSGGVLFIILVATLGGFIFLRRTLKQIDYITKNVEEIDERKLNLRLNIKGKDAIAKMSQTFDTMLDKLESSFYNRKLFFKNASHELNTPLTVIKTNIDVLRQNKDASKKEYDDVINIINNEIKKLSEISDSLLDLTFNESTKKTKKNLSSPPFLHYFILLWLYKFKI